MGWFPTLFGQGETKALRGAQKDVYAGGLSLRILNERSPRGHADVARAMEWDETLAKAFYRSVWAYVGVETYARLTSALPIRRREVKPDGTPGDDVDDDPWVRLLNRTANPLESGKVLRHRISQQFLTSRRGVFVEVTVSRRGTPIMLELLPADRTRPVPTSGGVVRTGRITDMVDRFEVEPADGKGPPRPIAAESVRWIRAPNPSDPYASQTPFDPLGITLDLDYYAHRWNAAFMRNDGRPGTLIGVSSDDDEGMTDEEMDRIERKFPRGYSEAGSTTVIAGKLTALDMAKTPRDAEWNGINHQAMVEVFSALFLSPAMVGHASGETFANAAEGKESSWQNGLVPHADAIADGLDGDPDDEVELYHDFTGIEALQQARVRQMALDLQVLAAGGMTLREFRQRNRIADDDKSFDVPGGRTLWVPGGKVPIAGTPADQTAVEKITKPSPPETAGAPNPEVTAQRRGVPLQLVPAARRGDDDDEDGPRGQGSPGPNEERDARGRVVAVKAAPDDDEAADPAVDRLEAALAAAFAGYAVDQAETVIARLKGPKARQGTRLYVPPGTGKLDAARIVAAEKWADTAARTAAGLIGPAAASAAEGLLEAIGDEAKALPPEFTEQVGEATDTAVQMVRDAALAHAQRLIVFIEAQDAEGKSLDEIVGAVRDRAREQAAWADALAGDAASGSINGARYLTAVKSGRPVTRTWLSRRDDKVREPHKVAHSQTKAVGEPFEVGGERLRWPGDPKGSPENVRNCRCVARYRDAASGKFYAT